MAEDSVFKFCIQLSQWPTSTTSLGMTNNPWKRYKIETQLQWKTSRKSHMAYQMARTSVTLNELESHFSCLKPFLILYLDIQHVLTTISLYINQKAQVACNFNCLIKTLKVTGSHLYCKSGTFSEMVQYTDIVAISTNRKWYMAYQTVSIRTTLHDYEGHLPSASIFKRNFLSSSWQAFKWHCVLYGPMLCNSWTSCQI